MKHLVAIPTFGRAGEVDALLASLERQTVRPDRVVVADDTEGDAVQEVVARHKGVRYLRHTGERSAAGARNLAAKGVEADLVTFLDSDALLEPDYVERIQAAMARHPDALGAMGLALGHRRIGPLRQAFAALFAQSRPSRTRCWVSPICSSRYPLDVAGDVPSNWLWGCNMTFRKPEFDAAGGFHPQFIRYSYLEDLELGFRLQRLHPGRRFVLAPDARFHHGKSPADRLSSLDTERMRIVNRHLILRQHPGRRWYHAPLALWSDLGLVAIKHYRRPWEVPAQLWNLATSWALVARFRRDLGRGDLSRLNRRYRFARASRPA
jgi:GT2 family glycosyltransferase